jgi:DNA processing protein
VPLAQHFPQRNRIISGLSLATVVVEASLKSGSLITARLALEQNREVFAVPGFPMDPRCQGANKLIKEGAHLLESIDDIFRHLPNNIAFAGQLEEKSESSFKVMETDYPYVTQALRNKVLSALSSTPISMVNLLQETELPIQMLYTILLELELAGRISRHPGGRISLVY